jgi:two-component system cell cycle sensor histidine kinase/response regulator CckA
MSTHTITPTPVWEETDRLEALEEYGILDTPREDEFDGIARLAAQICGTPISAITFIAKEKQWFKAEVGLGCRETPLEASFCKHAIRQKAPFVVNDTTKDARFSAHPLVIGKPYARFYAGIPLETPEGIAIGALCVLDRKPRILTENETLSLTALARLAMIQLELRRSQIDRNASEQRLRVSELSYRRLFEAAKDGIFILDADSGRITDVNPFLCEFLGFSRDEVLGKTISEISPFKDIEANQAMLARLQDTGYVRYENLPLKSNDGRSMAVECVCNVYWAGDKKVIQCNVRDITERKRTEARFRRLVDSNAQGVIFWNTKGEITGANDAFLLMVGFSRAELEAGQMNWATMTPPEHAERDIVALQKLKDGGSAVPYEKMFIRKDGSRVWVLVGAALFEDSAEEGVCYVVDLTEPKKLELQFLRAQRMESVGTLAGGIAHDLNNILAPILMAVHLLKDLAEDPQVTEILETLEASATRGAEIVRQVLSFARGMDGEKIDVQARHLIKDVEGIIRNTFPKNIRLVTTLPADLWTVLGDPTQIHQILLNLCVNARDAMPNGGTLSIQTENCVLDEQYAAMNLQAKAGRYVQISVTDTGTGMAPNIVERIFEPFFTTKEMSKGTGLGLSTVMAIVKSHHGIINVYSEPGKGTSFKLYLPATTTPGTAHPEEIEDLILPRGKGETILVVDDETSIRNITRQTLENFGYCVLTATDGADGVAIYAQHAAEIDIVLTDMMMPILAGHPMIRALRRINPLVKVITTSGLDASDGETVGAGDGGKYFLLKPYTAATLLNSVRATLDHV